MFHQKIPIIFLILPFYSLIFILSVKRPIYAFNRELKATVQMSVCGNGDIEYGEDCEGTPSGATSCENYGYGPGPLSCDIACSFDFLKCPSPTPKPTDIITPTPTSSLSISVENVNQKILIEPTQTISPNPVPELSFLVDYDLNGDGHINLFEAKKAITDWVNFWKVSISEISFNSEKSQNTSKSYKCDINLDEICNIKDFSILLSHIAK